MTFKAAVAGLPLGGGKGVIMLRPDEAVLTPERRQAVLEDFGDTVESLGGDYLTAEDVGTSEPAMEVIATRTQHVTGLASGSGDPSPWTALGCEVGAARDVRARVRHRATSSGRTRRRDRPRQRRRPPGRAAARGRRASSSSPTSTRASVSSPSAWRATWTDPHSAMTAEVDVLAPCALGGVLNDDTVPALRCKAIAGAANNQLASDALDAALAERGILWAPDFVCNAGGIINIASSSSPSGYYPARADTQRPRRRRHAAPDLRQRGGERLDAADRGARGRAAARARGRAVGCQRGGGSGWPGRRPSSRSFSRCAFSVIAANGRTAAGASAHAASSSSSSSSRATRTPAPPAACARARRGGRGTRRAWRRVVDRVAVPGVDPSSPRARTAAARRGTPCSRPRRTRCPRPGRCHR